MVAVGRGRLRPDQPGEALPRIAATGEALDRALDMARDEAACIFGGLGIATLRSRRGLFGRHTLSDPMLSSADGFAVLVLVVALVALPGDPVARADVVHAQQDAVVSPLVGENLEGLARQ
jgi:hypothetical protein